MRIRPFSTLGWFMLEAIGAIHVDQTKDPVIKAWMLDALTPAESK